MKSPDETWSLPVDRAFVLQFDSSCPPECEPRDATCGRVEHVVSGRASRFRSFDEMRLFVTAVLREIAVKRGEAK